MKHKEITEAQDSFVIQEGLRIDLEEGWKKIVSRQFGGNPGRGFGELIQNFLDSYDEGTPWNKRKGIILTGKYWISLTDFGSGLSLTKVKLITTLGGTDKSAATGKIGKFGIGFFSIFNPRLGTKKVEITTICEGQPIKLEFIVYSSHKRPSVHYKILDDEIPFSTEVKVWFEYPDSVQKCLSYARQSLKYYPCDVTIDGNKFQSIWNDAKKKNAYWFDKKFCNGFIKSGSRFKGVTLLCKYEYIAGLSLKSLVTGGRNVNYNLEDYYNTNTPYVGNVELVINCNQLSVTISRDSWYLDFNFHNMVSDLNEVLLSYLNVHFHEMNNQIKLANLFIFRNQIQTHLKTRYREGSIGKSEDYIFNKLADAPLFRINGKKEMYSVKDILQKKSDDLPLYFSESRTNLRWLGGSFKHDFVVIPDECRIDGYMQDFYDKMFQSLFKDAVNLDTINKNKNKIKDLINRGIISKDALEPKCEFIKQWRLTGIERKFLSKLERLLNENGILQVIESNIQLPIKNIKPVFFRLKEKGMFISTGLFDQNQNIISDDLVSNIIQKKKEDDKDIVLNRENTILLGLHINHPFITKLIKSSDPQSEYYALTYLAHELTSCQKLLSPYSSFYNMVKAKLSAGLRKNMIDVITGMNN